MARIQIATDNFNRAGPALGANWVSLFPTWGDVLINSSTRFVGSSSSEEQAARWVGAGTFTNDQYSSVLINGSIPWIGAGYAVGTIVRASGDIDAARDYYAVLVDCDSSGPNYTTRLFKVVNGTRTPLHSAAVAWATNDRIELEAEGTTIRACKNGTALGGSFTVIDASIATGLPGIAAQGDAAFYGDDWVGGNLGSATSSVASILTQMIAG